jgi:hypothetical protein
VANPVEAVATPGEDIEKDCPIIVIMKDVLSCVASRGDVVKGSGEFNPKWTGHSNTPRQRNWLNSTN